METISDIVEEMRIAPGVDSSDWFTGKQVRDWADRVEDAAKATVVTDNTEVLHNLLAENARLKAVTRASESADDVIDDMRREIFNTVYNVDRDKVIEFVERLDRAMAQIRR